MNGLYVVGLERRLLVWHAGGMPPPVKSDAASPEGSHHEMDIRRHKSEWASIPAFTSHKGAFNCSGSELFLATEAKTAGQEKPCHKQQGHRHCRHSTFTRWSVSIVLQTGDYIHKGIRYAVATMRSGALSFVREVPLKSKVSVWVPP